MELKIKVHTITIKDEDSGEKYTVKTVRPAEEISGYIQETEKEALPDKVHDLAGQY